MLLGDGQLDLSFISRSVAASWAQGIVAQTIPRGDRVFLDLFLKNFFGSCICRRRFRLRVMVSQGMASIRIPFVVVATNKAPRAYVLYGHLVFSFYSRKKTRSGLDFRVLQIMQLLHM